MSRVVRTALTPIFLVGAFNAAATVACTASTSPVSSEEVSSTSEAVVSGPPKCANGQVVDDCSDPCPNGYNATTHACNPGVIKCATGYHLSGGQCVVNTPVVTNCGAGEVNSGGTCVPCGGLNGTTPEPICNSTTGSFSAACTEAGTVSNGTDCVPCGAATQPVCAAGNCTQNNTVDSGGTCVLCGGLNATPEPICNSASTPNFGATGECTPANSVDSGGFCAPCGTINALICNASSNPGNVFRGPCTQLNTASNGTDCVQVCLFDPSCPPGMYNTTPPLVSTTDNVTPCNPALGCNVGGYQTPVPPGAPPGTGFVPTSSAFDAPIEPYGCTFTPPAAAGCLTTGNITVTNAATNAYTYTNTAQWVTSFQAPVVTSVVLGGSSVYAIASPPPGQPGESTSGGPNAVFAWGDNEFYQLGNGSTDFSKTPQVPLYNAPVPAAANGGTPLAAYEVVQLVAGIEDACALLSDGSVHCWGTPMTWPSVQTWPTNTVITFPPDTVTGVVPGNPNLLPKGADPIVQITHGSHHACALTSTGNVYCWGNNDYEQLGLSQSQQSAVNTNPLPQTTGVFVWEVPLATNAAGPAVPVIAKVTQVAASGNTTCLRGYEQGEYSATNPALNTTQYVYCWGDDTWGSAATPGQSINGNSWFSNTYTQVGLVGGAGANAGANVTNLVGASLGAQGLYGSFCAYVGALAATGTITNGWLCWGGNDQQQLDWPNASPQGGGVNASNVPFPLGDLSGTSTGLPATGIESAPWLILGESHSCAAGVSGSYCFGGNGDGQLGPVSGSIDFATAAPAPPSPFPSFTTPQATAPTGTFAVSPFAVGNDLTCGIYVSSEPVYNPANPANNAPGSYGVVDPFGNVTGNATGNLACWGGGPSDLGTSPEPTLLNW